MPESGCAYGAMLYCTAVATEGEAPRAVPEQAPGHVVHALPLGCVADDSTKSHLLHVQSPPLIDRVAVQGRPVWIQIVKRVRESLVHPRIVERNSPNSQQLVIVHSHGWCRSPLT